jgi:hypothetical protein
MSINATLLAAAVNALDASSNIHHLGGAGSFEEAKEEDFKVGYCVSICGLL